MAMGLLVLLVLSAMAQVAYCGGGAMNYGEAAQRSGVLPDSQRIAWRANSGFNGVDLTGGYCRAGDNVKFGLPMAFTVTMMAWSVLEHGEQMGAAGEVGHPVEAIKWGTDYLVRAHPEPNVLYGEVGNGDTDHNCWQRPEDLATSRQTYHRLDAQNPGSDLAGETAAAMAAASLVFRGSNPDYANQLLEHSKQLFDFADKYRGVPHGSVSGYEDELLWAAAWLFHATGDGQYLEYLANNADALGGTGWWSTIEFGWDVKYPGVQVLAAKILLQGKAGAHAAVLQRYQHKADFFLLAAYSDSLAAGHGGSGRFGRSLQDELATVAIDRDNRTSVAPPVCAAEPASPTGTLQNAARSWTEKGRAYRPYVARADEMVAILAPIAAYWITSGIYGLLAGWCTAYRLHSC